MSDTRKIDVISTNRKIIISPSLSSSSSSSSASSLGNVAHYCLMTHQSLSQESCELHILSKTKMLTINRKVNNCQWFVKASCVETHHQRMTNYGLWNSSLKLRIKLPHRRIPVRSTLKPRINWSLMIGMVRNACSILAKNISATTFIKFRWKTRNPCQLNEFLFIFLPFT